jgi:hypothetical protein
VVAFTVAIVGVSDVYVIVPVLFVAGVGSVKSGDPYGLSGGFVTVKVGVPLPTVKVAAALADSYKLFDA